MSLTEEARAPFSLVDEINQVRHGIPSPTFIDWNTKLLDPVYLIFLQGMDQRAERVVHNSMVNVTCKADSAQYFLITPKLLPDLMYHERMKILCVNNGEWLPDDRNLGKMMDMIDGYVARVRKWKRDRKANVGLWTMWSERLVREQSPLFLVDGLFLFLFHYPGYFFWWISWYFFPSPHIHESNPFSPYSTKSQLVYLSKFVSFF